MGREAGGVRTEDLSPDPGKVDEPSQDSLEERGRHPEKELLNGREVREPRETEDADEPLRDCQEVIRVLPVRFPHPLHQDEKGDVLPESEIPSGILARVEGDGLPLADLEDRPDHPDVPALLSLLLSSGSSYFLLIEERCAEPSAYALS